MKGLNFNFIIILLINLIKTEKIKLEQLELKSNKLFSLSHFTYNNYTKEGPINQGLKYNIIFNPKNIFQNSNNLNNNILKFFFILSEPSLSINNKDIFCKDDNYFGKNKIYNKPISYIKNYTIVNNNSDLIVNDNFTFYEKGVKEVYLLFCNINNNNKLIEEKMYLNGEVSLFNTKSYESAENFFRSYLYLIITCYYFIFSLYWVFKMLTNTNKINTLMIIFSIIIPFILLENIMRIEFYNSLKDEGIYNFPFKIMEIIFKCIKGIGIRVIYFFIAHSFQTLNKFPNKVDFQFFLIILSFFVFSFALYESSLVQYESDFINHPIFFLFISTIIFLGINIYIWLFYFYRKIKIFEKNFKEKNFKKNEKILNSYSFSLFAGFISFCVYVIIFILTFIFSNLFVKVYFKWVGDLADRMMSIFFFTTICFNLWEQSERTNYIYDVEINNGNKYHHAQNVSDGTENKDKKQNLPENEENKK